ncbi:hypothetical protein OVA14_11610 [Agrococcus sp. SL85]|uniref:hypothetical protein n=1 Tax=Agrococcus sp. SL85 TaxID=2995141 RepID=UPI00226D10C9|nr:hypothetical protein [Agrococcus sp. SL85]WAC65929.1 hypothetical protein OVA14_11610 [Agrococcus sp. SL85]
MTVTAATQRAQRPPWGVVLLRSLVALGLALAVVAATAVAFAPAPPVEATALPIAEPEAPEPSVAWPETARAAGYAVVGAEGSARHVGSEGAHPMASVTKLVTVLVVLDAHPIAGDDRGASITMGRADVNAVGAALADNAPIAPVYEGMVVTQRDLIEWSLVDSAGNAAWSLAHWAFGSIDAFLAAADAYAAEHGLPQTDLADPAGLDAASVSSAADLTQVALLAVTDPVILATLQLESVRIPGIGSAPNTNRILGEGDVDGGKTGTLRVWGRNLFATAVRDVDGREQRVVAIVMGTITADDIDAQMLALVDSLWDDFGERTVLPAGTAVAEHRAPWGETVVATTTEELALETFGDIVPAASAEVGSVAVDAPRRDVGEAWFAGQDGARVATPVRTSGILEGPSLQWRLAHPAEVLGWYRVG